MNLARNVLILSIVLLVAVPQTSSSSTWRETETGPDELASRHTRSASSAGATNAARSSFERSSGIIADDKIVRRQVKAGKKSKLPVFVEAKPSLTDFCGPTPPSPLLSCSGGAPVSDDTEALDAVCPDCADETMTASKFEKLRIAPTPTCSALGYKALLGTSTSIPQVECLSSYLQEAAAAKTADSGIPGTSNDDFDQVMIDFCVHQCSQEYWDGLASELKKNDVNAFILETCKPSFPLERGENSCGVGDDACLDSVYTAIGDDSCLGEEVCKNSEYATIGNNACHSSSYACLYVENSNLGDNSCDGTYACIGSQYVTIGKNACVGYGPCSYMAYVNVGENSCVSTTIDKVTGACYKSALATIGTNSCLAKEACSCIGNDGYGCSGIADKPVTIGNGSCTKQNSCKGISVDVGHGSCTYAGSCSCDGFEDNFSGGVPDNTCASAGEGGRCCAPD
jgi:hypothetical protein